jgi:hypothetical protein
MTTSTTNDRFDKARAQAARGNLVVVREDGQWLLLPALPRTSVKPEMVAAIERMIPSTTKRNVAVIADTSWATSAAPSIQIANQAIPFFGLLMGIATVGHSVWTFDGEVNLVNAGCREADVLIVDSASVPLMPADWAIEAEKVMRNPQILVHDRNSYQLRSFQPEQERRRLQ